MNSSLQHIGPNILVAPLDWGLGHTTRCIPIIYELLAQGARVFVAGNEIQRQLLAKEFPQCRFLHLEGYGVKYAAKNWAFLPQMVWQVPRILKVIQKEQIWLQQIQRKFEIAGVISDNRYGLYSHLVPSVFITHQLLVKTPFGASCDAMVQKLNYRFINRFSSCWVPDFASLPGLAGDLSHPKKLPQIPVHYLGILSRMRMVKTNGNNTMAIILSGPEPQRSIFEQIICKQLPDIEQPVVLVRGLPSGGPSLTMLPANVTIFDHLTSLQLNELMASSKLVICRSGYSSIMDIMKTGAHSVLVPTPGQTEQEYLAERLEGIGFAPMVTQQNFSLKRIMAKASAFSYSHPGAEPSDSLPGIITQFLSKAH